MKYIVRALKYFVYIVVIMTVILFILAKLKFINGDISTMFKNGYDSLWQLALIFLAISALYPRVGYNKRGAVIPGEYAEVRPGILEYMENHGYKLEKEEGENLTFRRDSFLQRLTRMFEDRVTFTRDLPGFYIEGLTKDVVRLVSGLEYKFRTPDCDD